MVGSNLQLEMQYPQEIQRSARKQWVHVNTRLIKFTGKCKRKEGREGGNGESEVERKREGGREGGMVGSRERLTSPPTAQAPMACPPKQPKNVLVTSSQMPSLPPSESSGHKKMIM